MGKSEKEHKWLSIRQKLMSSYLVLVLIIFLLGGVVLYGSYRVYNNGSIIYSNHLQAVASLRQLSQNLREIDRDVILLTNSPEGSRSDYIYDILILRTQNGHLLDDYSQLAETDMAQYEQCQQNIDMFNTNTDEILEQLEAGEVRTESLEALTAAEKDALRLLNSMVEQSNREADEKNLENQSIFSGLFAVTIAICLAASGVAAVMALYISNYFTKRLNTIRSFAKRMAEYDISDDIKDVHEDEIGRTMMALNDSQFMIRELIEKIISETSDMSDMGSDISNALRKTCDRIQSVSLLIMQSGKMAELMDTTVSDLLAERKLEEPVADQLRKLLPESDKARDMLSEAMGEMNGITMQLEQIAVTSDYQNELANSRKERISLFKLQQSTAEEPNE